MKNKTVKAPFLFEKITTTLTTVLGSTAAFVIAFFILIVWIINPVLTILMSIK